MESYYQGKTVIVTGASSGIGEQIVRFLAKMNCNLVLCARSTEKMTKIAEDSGLNSSNSMVVPVDFSKQVEYNQLVNQILSKFPKIDILINNAGIAQKSLVQETEEVVERRVMEVNYFATIGFSKALLPHLIANKSGQIIAISSILGEIGLPFVGPYCASKHAINGYFESMRYDVEKLGIDIGVVSPGFIRTEITKKSLTGTGEVHAKDSVAQEKGMPADQCAKKILEKIAKRKSKAYVGGLEVLMPKFAFFFPRLFHGLMRKMHKI